MFIDIDRVDIRMNTAWWLLASHVKRPPDYLLMVTLSVKVTVIFVYKRLVFTFTWIQVYAYSHGYKRTLFAYPELTYIEKTNFDMKLNAKSWQDIKSTSPAQPSPVHTLVWPASRCRLSFAIVAVGWTNRRSGFSMITKDRMTNWRKM